MYDLGIERNNTTIKSNTEVSIFIFGFTHTNITKIINCYNRIIIKFEYLIIKVYEKYLFFNLFHFYY
jgi:hypothetical protein